MEKLLFGLFSSSRERFGNVSMDGFAVVDVVAVDDNVVVGGIVVDFAVGELGPAGFKVG